MAHSPEIEPYSEGEVEIAKGAMLSVLWWYQEPSFRRGNIVFLVFEN